MILVVFYAHFNFEIREVFILYFLRISLVTLHYAQYCVKFTTVLVLIIN